MSAHSLGMFQAGESCTCCCWCCCCCCGVVVVVVVVVVLLLWWWWWWCRCRCRCCSSFFSSFLFQVFRYLFRSLGFGFSEKSSTVWTGNLSQNDYSNWALFKTLVFCIGYEILPSVMRIMVSHCKSSFYPTRISCNATTFMNTASLCDQLTIWPLLTLRSIFFLYKQIVHLRKTIVGCDISIVFFVHGHDII